MAYYNICPECGAYLDPGEVCDCRRQKEKEAQVREQISRNVQKYFMTEKNGQMKLAI